MECFHCLEAQVLLYSSHWDQAFDWSQSFLGHSSPYHYPRARMGDSLFSLWDLLSPSSADALCEHALNNRQSHFSSNYVWPIFSCFFSFHPACTRHAATQVMLQLESCLPHFFLEVQALIRGELDDIPTSLYGVHLLLSLYISIVGFSKLPWLISTFFTYSFYSSTHRTQIQKSFAWFIHIILSDQQFDIGQVIIDVMTPYHDPSYWGSDFSFALLISFILENVGFELDLALGIQATHAYLDGSLWAKHYNRVYGSMAHPTHHDL